MGEIPYLNSIPPAPLLVTNMLCVVVLVVEQSVSRTERSCQIVRVNKALTEIPYLLFSTATSTIHITRSMAYMGYVSGGIVTPKAPTRIGGIRNWTQGDYTISAPKFGSNTYRQIPALHSSR